MISKSKYHFGSVLEYASPVWCTSDSILSLGQIQTSAAHRAIDQLVYQEELKIYQIGRTKNFPVSGRQGEKKESVQIFFDLTIIIR